MGVFPAGRSVRLKNSTISRFITSWSASRSKPSGSRAPSPAMIFSAGGKLTASITRDTCLGRPTHTPTPDMPLPWPRPRSLARPARSRDLGVIKPCRRPHATRRSARSLLQPVAHCGPPASRTQSIDRGSPASDRARVSVSRSRREERAPRAWDTTERQGMTRQSARLAHRSWDSRRSKTAQLPPSERCRGAGSRAGGPRDA